MRRGAIAVLGGGVSGLTTALTLQLHGYDTVLITRDLATDSLGDPTFASIHAAASILPHTVRSSRLTQWTQRSNGVFGALAFMADAGVRRQIHYEVFESSQVEAPAYATAVDQFALLDVEQIKQVRAPMLESADAVAGWRFGAYFCEGPRYLRYLTDLYKANQWTLEKLPAAKDGHGLVSRVAERYPAIVNCTGISAIELLTQAQRDGVRDVADLEGSEPLVDSAGPRVVRGHYLRAPLASDLRDSDGNVLSYNYTPAASRYPGRDGRAADVYCYPRSDAWVLGGTRQPLLSTLDHPAWPEDEFGLGVATFAGVDGRLVEVPKAMVDINTELVLYITNGAIDLRTNADRLYAGVGYRFERNDPNESVRVTVSRVNHAGQDSVIIHNYGHGGAGFTLSWGCAVDVLGIIEKLERLGWTKRRRSQLNPRQQPVEAMLLTAIDRSREA